MTALRILWSRAVDLLVRRRRDDRLSEEVQAHLDLLIDEHIARGLSPAAARLAARRSFGGVEQTKMRYRDQRGFPLIDGIIQDTRYATRLIARDRWFTAAAVVALALGLGVSSTMLTVIYSMNLRTLPFQDPARIMAIGGESNRAQDGRIPFAVFDAWRSVSKSFSMMAAHVDGRSNIGDDTHAADQFAGTFVSHNAFAVLGERPILGRDFLPEDDRIGAAPVVIISHGVWAERYGSDPATIGRAVRVDGRPSTVIGIMPDGFRYPFTSEVWRPLAAMPVMSTPAAGLNRVRIAARLADGVTMEQARAELSAIVSTLATIPVTDRTRRTIVMPINESFFGRVTDPAPLVIMTAVAMLLLMSCAHAANLLLARSAARAREMSVRASLGASRARIVRQLLVESVLLATMAGMLGLVLASAGVRWFANEVADFGMPYWAIFSFDARLFSYFAIVSLGTGIGFGLVPALHLSRTNLTEVLNQGGRSGMAGPRARRMTTTLLVGELALTVVLLASAGVLVQGANVVYRADQTIDLADLWVFRVMLPQPAYASSDRRNAFYQALDQRLGAAPGMESATLASAAPFASGDSTEFRMDNEPVSAGEPAPTVRVVAIGDRYFDTLGLRLIRGTRFEDLDSSSAPTAALVNERFVDRFSAGVDPIGRQVLLVNGRTPGTPPERFTIVGIAPPIRQATAAGLIPVVYVPHGTQPASSAWIIVRGDPRTFAETLRQQVRRMDPDLPLFGLESLVRVSEKSRWTQRLTSMFFSILAAIATLLSALGLYAITAYSTAQRKQEVGVRLALGARGSQVLWLFLRGAMLQLLIGLTIGMAGAFAAGTVLQGLLVDVRANNPLTLAGACLLLAAVSIVATLLPARRASRLDPVAALRQE